MSLDAFTKESLSIAEQAKSAAGSAYDSEQHIVEALCALTRAVLLLVDVQRCGGRLRGEL